MHNGVEKRHDLNEDKTVIPEKQEHNKKRLLIKLPQEETISEAGCLRANSRRLYYVPVCSTTKSQLPVRPKAPCNAKYYHRRAVNGTLFYE